MAKNNPIQKLEVVRRELEMTKGAFAEVLGISRMWYDQILNEGKTIDPKTLNMVCVDHVGTPVGDLAVELMIAWHGRQNVPCVCQTELGDCGPCPKHGDVKTFMEFLEGCDINDLAKTAPPFSPEQKFILRQFIQSRSDKQFKAMKAGVAA